MLRAAIVGGTDAVYLGLKQFSARASAGNFSPDELKTGVRLAHAYGVRVYVALNTLMTDRELRAAKDCVRVCADASADGVIVQDLGLFSLLRESTDLPLHLSTQGGIFNREGGAFARELGFSRVVLARESEEKEISDIRALGLEVEIFVHGALCTGFSGNCYLSSFLSSTSGNRGRCLQPCRLKYRCFENEGKTLLAEGYLLSSRDECLLNRAGELAALGADSLKIEGRLKRPEYTSECARAYRAALDGKGKPADLDSLKKLYNRGGFIEGLGRGRKGVICRAAQGHCGVYAGKILRLGRPYGGGRLAYADANSAPGDGFKLFRGGKEVGSAVCGAEGLTARGDVRVGDELFVTTDAGQLAEISSRERKIPVGIRLTARAGEPLSAVLTSGGKSVTVAGATPEPAKNRPLERADFLACFEKTGETPFSLVSFELDADGVFLPKSVLNAFRRECYDSLFDALAQGEVRRFDGTRFDALLAARPSKNIGGESVRRIGAFSGFREEAEDCDLLVYSPRDYFEGGFWKEYEKLKSVGKPVYLDLPLFLYRSDFEKFRIAAREFDGICAHNPAGAELARELGTKLLLAPDCNVMNALAARAWQNFYPCDIVLSEELCSAQAMELARETGAFVLAFGRQVLMHLNHCAARETLGGNCADCRWREVEYQNEYGQRFPVERVFVGNLAAGGGILLSDERGEHCYFRILNGLFTDKREAELPERIFCDYSRGVPEGERTFGHWKRRVL